MVARRSDYEWRPPAWLAVVAVAMAATIYVTVAWSARYPVISLDEVVMVGNSRVLAGLPGDWPLSDSGFMPGLAILMAPLWWFTDSPVVVYQVGIWITVALGLLAIWPLSAIACRAGVTRTASVIIATVVAVAPARTLLSNYLLSESLFLVLTAALVVAADRLWARHTNADALWFGAAVGASVLVHGRGVGTAVAAGLWSLLLLRRDRKRAFLAGTSAVVASVGAYLLYRAVTSEVIVGDARVTHAFGNVHEHDVGASVASAIGQLWYPTLAWPAVAVIGGMAVFRWLRRGGMASFILLGLVTALIVSTVQLNPHAGLTRMDPWFYGRYMDQWWTILSVVGLALVARVRWPAMSATALGASAVAGLGMLLVTVPAMPKGMRWVDLHVLGASPWLRLDRYADGHPQQWGVIVLTGIALTVAVLTVGFIRVWVLPVLAVLWMWLSIAQDIQGIDIRSGDRDPSVDSLGLRQLHAGSPIGVDEGLGARANLVVFAADPLLVVKADPLEPPEGVDVVYVHWLRANQPPAGARLFEPTVGGKFVAWIYPGELARELDGLGLLTDPASEPSAKTELSGTKIVESEP